jgi:hypothetical protein
MESAAAQSVFPARVRVYLMTALKGAPAVMAALLDALTDAEADFRPDPDRFTIREALSHLADWEDVFTGRIVKTLEEDTPTLVGIDEGAVAIERRYSERPWAEQARLYAERRAQLAALLEGLSASDWRRVGVHTEVGPVTVQDQFALIVGHDGYHLEHVVAWRAAFRSASGSS